MQGPIDRRDSGPGGFIAFGHRWSHYSRAYMLRLDPTPMVPAYSGTDGPVAFGHRWSLSNFFFFRHRWSCCIWAQMVPCIRAQMVPFLIVFFSFFSQAQMVLLHLGTDGPLHSGTDGPFLIGFFFPSFFSQAQMVLVHLDTDGPIAFVHTSSYWIRVQMVPSVIRHRWSCCIWAQMVAHCIRT